MDFLINITGPNELAPATKPALAGLLKGVPLGQLQAKRYVPLIKR